MAVYDDYDGAYFTATSLRLHHPEVADRVEILLIDNNPTGMAGHALRALQDTVPGLRYLPVDHIKGTGVRDLVFREARTDWVLCVDCHVLLAPGALARFLEYAAAHPDSADLLQGPLLDGDMTTVHTHWDPVWNGLFGIWGTDSRGTDPEAAPFEIGMQGLGLFGCRKDAWLGFNPRMRGHGGEEGYLHKKYRSAGHTTWCLPFLRWTHRFTRPAGIPFPVDRRDRLRNYLIGWEETGMAVEEILDHFRDLWPTSPIDFWAQQYEAEKANPFSYFDALVCLTFDIAPAHWPRTLERLHVLGIRDRVRSLPAAPAPGGPQVARALAHRRTVAQARQQAINHVLVMEDDVVLPDSTLQELAARIPELQQQPWTVAFLAGCPGSVAAPSSGHAIAYHHTVYERILAELPEDQDTMAGWITTHTSIDHYYHRMLTT